HPLCPRRTPCRPSTGPSPTSTARASPRWSSCTWCPTCTTHLPPGPFTTRRRPTRSWKPLWRPKHGPSWRSSLCPGPRRRASRRAWCSCGRATRATSAGPSPKLPRSCRPARWCWPSTTRARGRRCSLARWPLSVPHTASSRCSSSHPSPRSD
ncbi:hypothetical protein APUTEX25_000719, partial [Auxenochlorella protothecoides]